MQINLKKESGGTLIGRSPPMCFMHILKVGKNDAGQRLDKFLAKAVRGLPMSLMYKYNKKIQKLQEFQLF